MNHAVDRNLLFGIQAVPMDFIPRDVLDAWWKHDPAESRAQREKYTARAMEVLSEAVAAGYKNVAHMKQNRDLDPLREREDFRKLLAELEAKGK